MKIEEIPIGKIAADVHSQRLEMSEDKLMELVASIRSSGLLQPLSVKAIDDGFVLIYGHRRLEACKRLGHATVSCIIATGDEASLRTKTFEENFYREDLTPMELAVAIADEEKSGRMNVEQLAYGFKRTTDWVRRQIAICSWPTDIHEAIHSGALSVAAASNLAQITEDYYRQVLVRQACENGATARTTAAWLQAWQSMLPMDEAVAVEVPEEGGSVMPMVPQAPCLVCKEVFRVDELSHIPICRFCVKTLAEAQCKV